MHLDDDLDPPAILPNYLVEKSLTDTIFGYDKKRNQVWSRIIDEPNVERIKRNATIQYMEVSIKPIGLTQGKHHREIYDRIYDAFYSDEYLVGPNRYLCNVMAGRNETLADLISHKRFQVFIEALLEQLGGVKTVVAFHHKLVTEGKVAIAFHQFAREFYENLMSDFRESFHGA